MMDLLLLLLGLWRGEGCSFCSVELSGGLSLEKSGGWWMRQLSALQFGGG